MKLLLPLLALAALALATTAQAQVEADATMMISGLQAQRTNATVAAMPFSLQLEVSGFPCVGQGATMTVALAAVTTGNATVAVQPDTMTFIVPANTGFTGYSHSQGGTVVLAPANAGGGNSTVTLTATMTNIEGCVTASTSGFTTEATANVEFVASATSTSTAGQAMPGIQAGLLALALCALAFGRRA